MIIMITIILMIVVVIIMIMIIRRDGKQWNWVLESIATVVE